MTKKIYLPLHESIEAGYRPIHTQRKLSYTIIYFVLITISPQAYYHFLYSHPTTFERLYFELQRPLLPPSVNPMEPYPRRWIYDKYPHQYYGGIITATAINSDQNLVHSPIFSSSTQGILSCSSPTTRNIAGYCYYYTPATTSRAVGDIALSTHDVKKVVRATHPCCGSILAS